MAFQWFYTASGEEVGPISSDELRNLAQCGTVKRDTAVRKAPDGDWVPAERVKGLFESPADSPASQPTSSHKETNMTVEERLARLEKAVDNGTALDGTTLGGVTARAFCLVDGEGNRRALLGLLDTTQNGAGLQLFDEKGMTRAGLVLGEKGLILTLSDKEGKVRVSLGVVEGGPVLSLVDKTDNANIQLSCGENGPALDMCDGVGTMRVLLSISGLVLSNETGDMAAIANSETGPSLVLSNKKTGGGAELRVNEQGSHLGLVDEHGNPCAIFSGRADGSALALFDEKGNIMWHAP